MYSLYEKSRCNHASAFSMHKKEDTAASSFK
nr:MAG TPA: hypothetical protein [Caudoviricetes sp.]